MSERPEDPNIQEQQIKTLLEQEHVTEAIEATVRLYGPEIVRFLSAWMGSEQAANEVYSSFCLYLCRGLTKFEWRSSLRTWVYVLARTAGQQHMRTPALQNKRNLPLSYARISQVADEVREQTQVWMRTELKDQFRDIRGELNEEERGLLVLRIDRQLDWMEIAEILVGPFESGEDASRAAARVRRRMSRLKKKLITLAHKRGLLEKYKEEP